jgi:hypothetical protein
MCGQIGMSVRQSAYSEHLNREQDLTAQGGKFLYPSRNRHRGCNHDNNDNRKNFHHVKTNNTPRTQ